MGLEVLDKMLNALNGMFEEVNSIVAYEAEELLQLRKDEILLGRNSEGDPFTPGYINDPYFNDPNRTIRMSAVAYSNYKQRIESLHNQRIEHILPYPNKSADTPNLRLTTDTYSPGNNFQDSMKISVAGDSFEITSTYKDANSINTKYMGKVYDPGPGARMYFWNELIVPGLINYFNKELS